MGGEAGAEGKSGFDMSVAGMALGVKGGFGCEDRIGSFRLAALWAVMEAACILSEGYISSSEIIDDGLV